MYAGRALTPIVSRVRPVLIVGLVTALLLTMQLPGTAVAQSVPTPTGGWQSDSTFSISFLTRDTPQGPDRYHVVFGYGATFFGTAVNAMPLLTAEQAVSILIAGHQSAYPDRPPQNVQPGDEFDIQVPVGTIVSAQWRRISGAIEYRSLRGDDLVLYTNPNSVVSYRLTRVEDPTHAEVALNRDMETTSASLARAVYGGNDPNFAPDILQVARAGKAIRGSENSITVDLTQSYMDDFPAIRAQAEKGGTTQGGLQIYWIRSDQVAQPLFRVDDGMGQATDPTSLPSLMRVYYYKDGTVRTYQRAEDTVMLRGRQPQNGEWAQVFAQYGKVAPAPTQWEVGQPEDSATAQELKQLGIVVLRYEPKPAPKGNLFTQFLDWLMALMKRKQS